MKLTQPKRLKFEYECSNHSDMDQVVLDISKYIKKGYTLIGAETKYQTEYRCNNIYTVKVELVYIGE